MNFKMIVFTGLMLWPLCALPAHAERLPRAGSADARVKTLTYHANDVYRLNGHYGFTTTIELSPKESIETISIGDSESWQITKPSRPNVLFVKPLEPNAQTNMTVFTTHRVYTFELAADTARSPRSDALTFRLEFKYPNSNLHIQNSTKNASYGLRADTPVSEWNFDYSYAGANRLRPERVFDDGTFTYFQFHEAVDDEGNESLINFTMQGPYLVVNRTERQFTLRDGNTATCIFNDGYPQITGTQAKARAIQEIEQRTTASGIPLPGRKPQRNSLLAWLGGLAVQPAVTASFNE